MTIFVDTSALLAVLDADDAGHQIALPAWRAGVEEGDGFVTTNNVLLETTALVQRRLGFPALHALVDDVLPLITTVWVTEADHTAGLSAVRAAAQRHLSLVDCVSFVVMRRLGIRRYLGLDPHFDEQGFRRYAAEG